MKYIIFFIDLVIICLIGVLLFCNTDIESISTSLNYKSLNSSVFNDSVIHFNCIQFYVDNAYFK